MLHMHIFSLLFSVFTVGRMTHSGSLSWKMYKKPFWQHVMLPPTPVPWLKAFKINTAIITRLNHGGPGLFLGHARSAQAV